MTEPRAAGSRSGLSSEHVEAFEWLRTDYQVRPHQGFKPDEIAQRSESFVLEDMPATMQLAKPPAWSTPDEYLACQREEATDADIDARTPEAARALCEGCPVKDLCLESAMEEEGSLGPKARFLVRGGLLPRERYTLYRSRIAQDFQKTAG